MCLKRYMLFHRIVDPVHVNVVQSHLLNGCLDHLGYVVVIYLCQLPGELCGYKDYYFLCKGRDSWPESN